MRRHTSSFDTGKNKKGVAGSRETGQKYQWNQTSEKQCVAESGEVSAFGSVRTSFQA
jgi:hypothetical protein